MDKVVSAVDESVVTETASTTDEATDKVVSTADKVETWSSPPRTRPWTRSPPRRTSSKPWSSPPILAKVASTADKVEAMVKSTVDETMDKVAYYGGGRSGEDHVQGGQGHGQVASNSVHGGQGLGRGRVHHGREHG